jgi:hypothetical protein
MGLPKRPKEWNPASASSNKKRDRALNPCLSFIASLEKYLAFTYIYIPSRSDIFINNCKIVGFRGSKKISGYMTVTHQNDPAGAG